MSRFLPATRAGWVRLGLVAASSLVLLLLPLLASLHEWIDPDNASARYDVILGTEAVVLGLWAVSFNLMLGYTGMVSFAHAAYYGVGAYTVALYNTRFHGHILVGLALAPLITGAFGLVTGLVALRAARLYFSLLTLAISQLLFVIAFEWYDFTGGDNGVHNLQIPDDILQPRTLYYITVAVVAGCLALMYGLIRSPLGAALMAIRENRQRASSVGLNVKAYELAVFTIAAAFAGVAGGLYAMYDQQAFPLLLYWSANAQPIVITLLGGTGTFLGPVVGAVIFTWMSVSIGRSFPYQFDIVLGAIVLAVVLIAPGGFVSIPEIFIRLRARFRTGERISRPELAGVGGAASSRGESAGDAIAALDVARVVAVEAASPEVFQAEPPPSDGQVLLKLDQLSRYFGGLRAVDGVSLEVRRGDLHAIIGPNGAGKSTLFNLVTGRLKPNAGRVWFDGKDITGKAAHAVARAGIGRAFQITNIFPKLSVRQNLQYSMLAFRGITVRPWGIADRIFRQEALDLLESVGLGKYADLPAGQLSHGDQRALELAISIALGSKLLLLDEPTAGMSPYETQKAMELVRRVVTEKKLTLLFCEHDMDVVFGTARRVTVMHLGEVLAEGSPAEIRSNPDVRRVYLGELEETA